MQAEQRVTVLDGPFKGTQGTVIKDMLLLGLFQHGAASPVPHDAVWVLLDVGDNPVRYPSRRLAVA